jgi:hypothetical protein
MFKTDEPHLSKILEEIDTGNIQLPDFQRGWVWDDDHIRSLIASITLSYPIGAIMLQQTGGEGVRFKPRLVEGVRLTRQIEPDKLILDGQQRLTSLYLSIKSKNPVPTKTEKGQSIERLYYLDIQKCLDPDEDRIDAVVSVPPEKIVRGVFGRDTVLDISTPEKEYQEGLVPLNLIIDYAAFEDWRNRYTMHYNHDSQIHKRLAEFGQMIMIPFQQYKIPVIEMLRETPKEAVCQVFEKVNTGGVELTIFELVTATFAADDFNLRDDWQKYKELFEDNRILSGVDATAFLTAITLLSTYRKSLESKGGVSCKRKDILKLSLDEYKANAQDIVNGFISAAKLLMREKIFDARNLPYTTQLIPLAAMCAVLGNKFEQDGTKRKLARWFWSGVFGELYGGGASESRFAFDLPEVIRWIDQQSEEPRTIRDSNFSPTRLLSLQSRLSAAYKGLMALLMNAGSKDFLNGDSIELNEYFELAIDIHHIFPKSYCEKEKLPRSQWNSIANKAPLSARTNRIIGGKAPSKYLANLEKNHDLESEQLNEILKSHQIIPEDIRGDNFEDFFIHRASRLLDLIEKATGKQISGRDSEEVIKGFGGPLDRV